MCSRVLSSVIMELFKLHQTNLNAISKLQTDLKAAERRLAEMVRRRGLLFFSCPSLNYFFLFPGSGLEYRFKILSAKCCSNWHNQCCEECRREKDYFQQGKREDSRANGSSTRYSTTCICTTSSIANISTRCQQNDALRLIADCKSKHLAECCQNPTVADEVTPNLTKWNDRRHQIAHFSCCVQM